MCMDMRKWLGSQHSTLLTWLAGLAMLLVCLGGCAEKPADSPPVSTNRPVIRVPDDFEFIQAAIDASRNGDTIVVSDGVYIGFGNRNLSISGKRIILKSENGPRSTVIDCQGTDIDPQYGIKFESGSSFTIVEGFSIRNGFASHGGAAYCLSSSPIFKDCAFVGNRGSTSGGAIRCKDSSPRFFNCTFVENSSPAGAGLFLIAQSSPVLENCIIAFSSEGGAVYSSDAASVPALECCDLFGNDGGDWEGRISDQANINGNFSADPQFCNLQRGDYRIRPQSPCSADMNPCGAQIGIIEPSCSDTL